jgi:hypothetical protein
MQDDRAQDRGIAKRAATEIGSFQGIATVQPIALGFSKSMGLTLCGMVEEPTSPETGFWRK